VRHEVRREVARPHAKTLLSHALAAPLFAASALSCVGDAPPSQVPIVALTALEKGAAPGVALTPPTVSASVGDGGSRGGRGALSWETSEPDARARARREGLPMLIYLRADWAVASIQMDRDVWSDARVIREGQRFVPLTIDLTSAEGDAEIYAERYGVPAVPAVLVLDAHGRRVALLSGPTGASEVLEAMRQAF
jgi:thiol:disulfide interchange protein